MDGHLSISSLFWERVKARPQRVAIREKDFGIWNEYSWQQYGENAMFVGLGLISLGLKRGDVCSIAAEVCKEWMFADLGIICSGGITNGVYPTDSTHQVEYLVNDSETRFYFAEDEEQLDKILEARDKTPSLEYIIIFDMEGLRDFEDPMCISFDSLLLIGKKFHKNNPDLWEQEIAKAQAEDLIALTYTSGTTGPPKGAMISHRNMLYMMITVQNIYGIEESDEQIGFLPLAHIAGRMFYTFSNIESSSTINLVEEAETVFQDIQEVSPSIHFAVPRVWEKQFSLISIKLEEGTAIGKWAYRIAIRIGYKVANYKKLDQSVPLSLKLSFSIANFLVLRNIKRFLGIENCKWLSTAAAPIAPELIDWYWALGKPMLEVYGQTECSGLITANEVGKVKNHSVGRVVENSEIMLSDQNELLLRGPGVIRGYWKKQQKTAETFRNGWLYSGDIGRIDEEGYVFVLDRLKDIIITAGGKNITPSEIENQLKFSPFISDAVVIGDRKKYLTCLVMIDQENVTKYAQDNDVPFTNYTSLCHTSAVLDLIWREIEKVNAKFARVETIKKFRLIDQLLDPEDEELTPTMKLKRKVVHEKYGDIIDEMY
ncbi:MAG: long-chain fatty acid--CoA ligase [Gammaproteobacteria bacterium]|nr:long-chain fatty acid--CoA ligase [Gammaproteobacteria bacterium]